MVHSTVFYIGLALLETQDRRAFPEKKRGKNSTSPKSVFICSLLLTFCFLISSSARHYLINEEFVKPAPLKTAQPHKLNIEYPSHEFVKLLQAWKNYDPKTMKIDIRYLKKSVSVQ